MMITSHLHVPLLIGGGGCRAHDLPSFPHPHTSGAPSIDDGFIVGMGGNEAASIRKT
jgi:hypothetical protein